MWVTNKGRGNIKVNISELPLNEGIRATTSNKEGKSKFHSFIHSFLLLYSKTWKTYLNYDSLIMFNLEVD